MKKKLVTTLLSVLGVVVLIAASAAADAVSYHFEGNGTKAEPYLIGSADDLLAFATAVNAGNSYDGMYFRQTQDINLADIDWPGIGVYETDACFMGTYNGDGHCVTNLNVAVGGNNAFFGKLGGTLMNFGIESGSISGSCVGGISSHSGKADALIINCYNKATVTGARAGGIADNFNGMLANCFSDCELIAASTEYVGGIVS